MDSQPVMQPAVIRPIPDAVQPIEDALRRCPGGKGACPHSFKPSSGFVPDLTTAYEQVRGTAVEPRRPLSRSEILSLELCHSCSHSRNFQRYGIHMYPTAGTLTLMVQWAEHNIWEKEAEKIRQLASEQQQHARGLEAAIRREDKGLVNETLARIKPRETPYSHRKRQYKGVPKPKRDPKAPKKFGDECRLTADTASTKRKKKNKEGDDKKGKRR